MFALAILSYLGADALGWVVTTSVWTDPAKGLGTASKAYAGIGGLGALILTYFALTVVLTLGAVLLGLNAARFAAAFTVVFWIAYASWFIGSFANLATVTPADQAKFGVSWSLRLTNEGGYIVALISGLVIANFLPRFADRLREAMKRSGRSATSRSRSSFSAASSPSPRRAS